MAKPNADQDLENLNNSHINDMMKFTGNLYKT